MNRQKKYGFSKYKNNDRYSHQNNSSNKSNFHHSPKSSKHSHHSKYKKKQRDRRSSSLSSDDVRPNKIKKYQHNNTPSSNHSFGSNHHTPKKSPNWNERHKMNSLKKSYSENRSPKIDKNESTKIDHNYPNLFGGNANLNENMNEMGIFSMKTDSFLQPNERPLIEYSTRNRPFERRCLDSKNLNPQYNTPNLKVPLEFGISINKNKLQQEEIHKIEEQSFAFNYASCLNARNNPDILTGGSQFLKGNKYYSCEIKPEEEKKTDDKNQNKSAVEHSPKKKNVKEEDALSEESVEDIEIDKKKLEQMMSTTTRYFITNKTIRCYRCDQVGHIAMNCPNDRVKEICYLCGFPDHDSSDCPQKLCFICNMTGHQAKDCEFYKIQDIKSIELLRDILNSTENGFVRRKGKQLTKNDFEKGIQILEKYNAFKELICNRCSCYGHKDFQCMVNPPEISSSDLKNAQCLVCRKKGHLNCMNKNITRNIKIDWETSPINDSFSDDSKSVSSTEKWGRPNDQIKKEDNHLNSILNDDNISKNIYADSLETHLKIPSNHPNKGKNLNLLLEKIKSKDKDKNERDRRWKSPKSNGLHCYRCGKNHMGLCEHHFPKNRSFDEARNYNLKNVMKLESIENALRTSK